MTTADVLSGRKAKFVGLLVAGMGQAEAGRELGVTRRTANRYMQDPAVRAALQAAQDDALADTTRRLNAGASQMLDVLQKVANDSTMPASVRVAAARTWLETMFRAKELLELTERITALEVKMGGEK